MSELIRGERPPLTRSEQALRALSWVLVAVSLFFGAVYIIAGVISSAEFPYAVNSVAKDALLAGLGLFVARDVRRHAAIGVPLIVVVHAVMPVLLVLTWLRHRNQIGHTMNQHWLAPTADVFRWTWFAADVLMVAGFVVLSFLAVRSRYALRYLWPGGYRALIALAEVLVPLSKDPERVPAEIGHSVDDYLHKFRARQKWKVWASLQLLAYWPLATLHPPFHLMSVDARRHWVERRFLDTTRDWLVPRFVRDLRRAVIRTAQQFSFMGYYGDERAAAKAGYVPFSRRVPPSVIAAHVKQPRRGVECLRPADIDGSLEDDFVVVGTGAAGALLAHELAERGHRVLLLERGSHVDPSTFTENEADQLARLYRDGALTLSKDFRFQVAQGMCVGGSTVVNNAVCFDLPERVRGRWLGELETGLHEDRLLDAFRYVRKFLGVRPLTPASRRNPGAEHLVKVLEGMPAGKRPMKLSLVECNIDGCLGCGYCNLGCSYGKKLSALDWTLPETQRKHPGAVRVLADCLVSKVLMRDGHAWGVRARLADGRKLDIHARSAVVLSAGALASSVILQRSGLGGRRAGEGIAFNMASPVTLEFDRELHSERGAQISHYYEPADGKRDGIALETWFNPIVTQSLFMPGWFEKHWNNMRNYAKMTCLGVVVGTESNASVKPAWGRTGVKPSWARTDVNLSYDPTDGDFIKIKQGIELACDIGLKLGACRAMPATFHGLDVRTGQLDRIESTVGDGSELLVNSAHPQGGNRLSRNPGKGVVDEHFRVYGAQGLYVCDASVFPSSITVNPQLTVMALAAYAAEEITGERRALS